MSYINDNPWPLLILLVGIAVAAFLSGSPKGRLVAMVSLVLAAGLYFLEQALISPGEQVELEVAAMVDNFKAEDIDAIALQICAPNEKLVKIAQQGLDMVELGESFSLKSVEVTLDSESTATAMVRANGDVSLKEHSGATHRVPNFWKTEWRMEGGTWKLASATRLNPVNGTELPYFSGQ